MVTQNKIYGIFEVILSDNTLGNFFLTYKSLIMYYGFCFLCVLMCKSLGLFFLPHAFSLALCFSPHLLVLTYLDLFAFILFCLILKMFRRQFIFNERARKDVDLHG